MIERASEFGASAAVPLMSGDSSNQSAGDMLRQAREAHGLDVAVVAAALKVPVQKIEALEADDIDALPDPVFARALAASVCRALRIDAKPVLAKLPGAPRPGVGVGETQRAMSASFHTGVQRSNGNFVSRTMLSVVGVLLVGAAALFWLPQSLLDDLSATVDRVMARGDTAQHEAPAAPAGVPGVPVVPGVAVEPVLPAAAAGAPVAVQDGPQTPPPPAVAAAAPPAAAPDLLAFNVRADSWISVTEASGKQLLHRTVPAGENVAVSGTLPVTVIVGRASGVDVLVRGKPQDLAPLTRGGGVARFEIKP